MASRRVSSQPQLRKYSIYPDKSFHVNHGLEEDNGVLNNYQGEDVYSYAEENLDPYADIGVGDGRKYSTALKVLKPFRPSRKDGKIPINKVGLFSFLLITWMSSLVWKVFRHRKEPLREEDIWECSDLEKCKLNTDRLTKLWNEELATHGPKKSSILRVWMKFSRTRILATLLVIAINALSTFFESGFLLNLIIAYMESPEYDLKYGIGLVAILIVCQFIRATSFCAIIIFGVQTGIRFRAGFLGIAFNKMLRLKSMKGKTQSEMINIFGSDAYRVYTNCVTFVYLLALPIYMIIGIAYTYYLIGPWCFIAIGIFTLCYLFQARLTTVVARLRRKTLIYTDRRVRKMTEIINSMKLIKMYAWENPFKSAVLEIRRLEKKYLLISAIINSISLAVIPVTPTLASVATIALYSAFGNELSAATAFAVVGTLNFLRVIVAFIPFATRTLGESRVSFNRLKRLLDEEEFEPPSSECRDAINAVEIIQATFIWDEAAVEDKKNNKKKNGRKQKETEKMTHRKSRESIHLNNTTFTAAKGRLIGICGPVGCGKSSLMSAVLGRMPMISGHLAVNGTVAYAAQQAWIFNGTLRENILFGKPYEQQRYQDVIFACGLQPDLLLLADGDETEIGARGTNLSGGQKQRVSLARAVYSNSDIYLLDDVLSAVDVHVGRHLFHTCIKKSLKDKTVIFTTHQLQYLKHCDEILVMEDGVFVEHGHHDKLMTTNGYYKKMMEQFHQNTNSSAQKSTAEESGPRITDENDQGSVPTKEKFESIPIEDKEEKVPEMGKLHKDNPNKGKLTEAEEMQVGDISWGTYKSYISAMGGFCIAIFVIVWNILTSGTVVFSEWWLSIWINTFNAGASSNSVNGPTNSSDVSTLLTTVVTKTLNSTLNGTTEQISSTIKTSPSVVYNNTGSGSETGGVDIYLIVYVSSLGVIVFMMLTKGLIGATFYIRAASRLHDRVLGNVMKAPMRFFDANPPGRILNRFSKDQDEADVFLPQMQDTLFQVSTQIALSLISAVVLLPWIGIAMVPVIIVYCVFKVVSAVSVRQFKRLENIARSPLLSHVNTTAQGLSTIVTYKQQKNAINGNMAFTDVSSTATFMFDCSMRWIGVRLDLSSACITMSTALTLILTKGSIDAALAALALTMCIRVVSIMQFMVRILNEVESRFTSIERLHQYEKKLESENQGYIEEPADNWPNEGRIVFSDVLMKYREDMEPVLREIRFDILPRQKIGIVGRTGAGKSSLAAALFRLNELSGGHIYIDGVDVSKIPLVLLRSKLSTIPQDPVLFAGSMRYNLDPFGLYTDEELWSALEDVHMKEKVKLFEKELDFIIEENGENFSVGERQLICLARAILRRNKILLLDEATASIDTATDAMIQQTIKESFSDCTVLTIAHRLNTVLHCDQIIIMDSGTVMEMGSPQDLLSDPYSFFNSMLSAQTVKTPSP